VEITTGLGLLAIIGMIATYSSAARQNQWMVLAFAGFCAMASAYAYLQGAWPFAIVEAACAIFEVLWLVIDKVNWQDANQCGDER
jgi:hypothetical protein